MPELSITSLLANYGHYAVFMLMVMNGITAIYPSSPWIYTPAGIAVGAGHMDFLTVVTFGMLGNVVGHMIWYELTRRKGLDWVINRFSFFRKHKSKIYSLGKAFEKKGPLKVFLFKFIPVAKAIVPIPAAMVKMNRLVFMAVTGVASFIWGALFVGVSSRFGKLDFTNITSVTVTAAIVISLSVVTWLFLREMSHNPFTIKNIVSNAQLLMHKIKLFFLRRVKKYSHN